MIVILAAYIFMNKKYRRYFHHLFTPTKQSHILELLRIGVPMGLMYCVEVGFFFVMALLMGSFGTQLLAANQITMQYMGTLMSVIFSIAQAITVRMGHLLGAGDPVSAKQTAYGGISISIILMLIVAICYWIFPNALISIDLDIDKPENMELVHFATQFLAVSSLFQIFEATRISLFGALRSLKDTHFTLIISIISFWGIALPIGYFLATRLGLAGTGLWWGMVLGAASSLLLLYWRFQYKMQHYSIKNS